MSFPYEKLEPGTIRLIRILPQLERADPVECLLQHVPLPVSGVPGPAVPVPEYVCLSYVWGDAESTSAITLNGHKVQTSKNLVEIMLGLRDLQRKSTRKGYRMPGLMEAPPRMDWWWIDALCIDQRDDAEKSEQVQRMRFIYQSAGTVIVWLRGINTRDTMTPEDQAEFGRCVAQSLVMISGELEDIDWDNRKVDEMEPRHHLYLKAFARRLMGGTATTFTDGRKRDEVLAAQLICFFGNIWWRRVWIQQEVGVARRVVFAYGGELMDMRRIVPVSTMLDNLHFLIREQVSGYISLLWMQAFLSTIVQNFHSVLNPTLQVENGSREEHRKLVSLVAHHVRLGMLESSDPRDKIFALLGLADDVDDCGIMVDYSVSARELFGIVTRALIRRYGVIILTYCSGLDTDLAHMSQNRRRMEEAPSWLPGWLVEMSPVPGLGEGNHAKYPDLPASCLSPASTPRFADVLLLEGRLVDTIAVVGDIFAIHYQDMGHPITVSRYVSKWLLDIDVRYHAFLWQDFNVFDTQESSDTERFRQVVLNLWKFPIKENVPEDDHRHMTSLREQYRILTHDGLGPPPDNMTDGVTELRAEQTLRYRNLLICQVNLSRWFITSRGCLGFGRSSTRVGDNVVVISSMHSGDSDIFIVREAAGTNGRFVLIGKSYIFPPSEPEGYRILSGTETGTIELV